jgi:hypothetical protein
MGKPSRNYWEGQQCQQLEERAPIFTMRRRAVVLPSFYLPVVFKAL